MKTNSTIKDLKTNTTNCCISTKPLFCCVNNVCNQFLYLITPHNLAVHNKYKYNSYLLDSSGAYRINDNSLKIKIKEFKSQMDQVANPETEDKSRTMIQNIIHLARSHYFLQSKKHNHDLIMDQIYDIQYLDIDHWILSVPKYFITSAQLQIQAADFDSDTDVSKTLDVKIDKYFEEHKLKSKKRRKSLPSRFSFNTKNAENFASPDQRSQFELFESILRMLHQQYTVPEYELLCKSCNYDLSVPQISENGVFMGNNFVKSLMKKYKRSQELCYNNNEKITQLLGELGYDKTEVNPS